MESLLNSEFKEGGGNQGVWSKLKFTIKVKKVP